jgi:uncharacterized membrane protein YgdD (TMEM256/DUF423 family)
MKNYWITTGGIFGFLAVMLGAFGAHGLKDTLSPEMMEIFRTGVFYHLIHSIVIFVIGVTGNRKFFKAALMFTIGIILFSFSLYLYSLTSTKTFAMITPFGGVSFLIGWLMVVISGVSISRNKSKDIN